jgi:hypothetical protein
MAQQTAVEFILAELDIAKLIEREKLIMAAEVVRQAKEMEKEQIMNAAKTVLFNSTGPGDTAAEQYYNETYGK